MNIFGSKVKELRIQKGITQEKLAEFLDVQLQTIGRIETGKSFISSALLAKICNFFNLSPYMFFIEQGQTYTPENLDHISNINRKLQDIYEIVRQIKNRG